MVPLAFSDHFEQILDMVGIGSAHSVRSKIGRFPATPVKAYCTQ